MHQLAFCYSMNCSGLFVVFCLVSCVKCANILLLPFHDGSHIMQMDSIGTAMLNRGHKVYVLQQEGVSMPKSTDHRYEFVYFGKVKNADEIAELTRHNSAGGADLTVLRATVDLTCTDMVTDYSLWQRLDKLLLDLVVVDYFLLACYYLVPYKLGVPFALLGSTVPMFDGRLPVLPSAARYVFEIEQLGPFRCYDRDSTPGIVLRLCQLASHILSLSVPLIFETDMHSYLDYPPMSQIRSNFCIALVNNSPLLGAFYPRTPNYEFVGGLTTKPAGPLSPELQRWMDEADNVVVVSFGSRFTRLSNAGNEKLLDAFSMLKLKYRFLVRFKTAEYQNVTLPPNVKIVDWLSQNDILGHKHTRLMITHCGLNGLFEALYHGVPVLCLHVDADQPSNSRKIECLGYGFGKKSSEFEPQWIVDKVNELCSNSSYRFNIRRASQIFLSERHPAERAADALEHVVRFGAEHLRPHEALKLTWWQFYMLDVVFIVYTLILALVYVIYKMLSAVFKRLWRICT